MMREECTQVRTLLRELSAQFEVMAGQIEQLTIFIRTAQSMYPSPSSHREVPVSTDPHPFTSRSVGTTLVHLTTDPQLPTVQDPSLESPTTILIPQQQPVGGSTSETSADPDDPPALSVR